MSEPYFMKIHQEESESQTEATCWTQKLKLCSTTLAQFQILCLHIPKIIGRRIINTKQEREVTGVNGGLAVHCCP